MAWVTLDQAAQSSSETVCLATTKHLPVSVAQRAKAPWRIAVSATQGKGDFTSCGVTRTTQQFKWKNWKMQPTLETLLAKDLTTSRGAAVLHHQKTARCLHGFLGPNERDLRRDGNSPIGLRTHQGLPRRLPRRPRTALPGWRPLRRGQKCSIRCQVQGICRGP